VRLAYGVRFGTATPVLLSEIEVTATAGHPLPTAVRVAAEEQINAALPQQLALSRVRRGRQVGLITDAFVLEPFIRAVLHACQDGLRLPCGDGQGDCASVHRAAGGLALDD
jgi:maltose alpha-D-glucosyltransferase/alpha-amylase